MLKPLGRIGNWIICTLSIINPAVGQLPNTNLPVPNSQLPSLILHAPAAADLFHVPTFTSPQKLPDIGAYSPNHSGISQMNGYSPVTPGQPNLWDNAISVDRVRQQAEIERDLKEYDFYEKNREKETSLRSYQQAFQALSRLDPKHFSLSEAVFQIENAYMNNGLDYKQYNRLLSIRIEAVKQIIKRQGLSPKNNLALNYAIQELFKHANPYYDSEEHHTYNLPAIKYDLDDYEGKKDYTKVLTSKLLTTNSGQCHSLPLVYLMIAEKLGAKAWLSLAPQHSFIQFMDDKGRLMNFETTNGNLVSSSWLSASGYITTSAIRNNTYLDTLSSKQLYARCLDDLLLSYLHKFTYDGFVQQLCQRILDLDPSNLTVLCVDANIKEAIAMQEINSAGRPKRQDLPKYPNAYKAYQDMIHTVNKINDLGYQDMPPEAYQAWLKSIDQEKERRIEQSLQQRIQRQIQQSKRTSPTIQHNRM